MMIMGSTICAAEAAGKTDYHAYAAELDKTAYTGSDLGATYGKKSTSFKVWAPQAKQVKLDLYEKGDEKEDKKSFKTVEMKLDKETGVWSASVSGDLSGKYYTYSVTTGKDTKVTGDVYARSCGVNGRRSMVVDPEKAVPEGWENDDHVFVARQTDATVWEISVADFSSNENSGVSEKHRGKFLAFTESGTTLNNIQGGPSTCVDYLKKLGVKYVQIMPMYDFGSVDESKDIMEQYNWGYDPVNYNCPEGSYSTNPKDGYSRVRECRQMIQALHSAGIGVIMDVVYNHTYSTESWFQYTVPNYYYRMNDDGSFSNDSGCSNDTASEHAMFRKYMIDSVTYWAKEYHIDGFRFDLMGLHDVTTMNEIRKALDKLYPDGSGERIIMYGEAWNMATNSAPGTEMANQSNMSKLNSRIGAFNDTIRDGIKGSVFGGGQGFIQNGSNRSAIKTGFTGQSSSTSGWAKAPTQCVTYASCHDNLALYDTLVDSVLHNEEYRKRHENLVAMNKLSAAIVMTSQGIPFFLGGEEFARSKDGDENSYSSARTENMLDWENVSLYSDIIEYYRGLMKIRDSFDAFRDSTSNTANWIETLENLPSGVCAYKVNNIQSEGWKTVVTIFNGSDDTQNVSLDGEWIKIADDETAGLRNLGTVTGNVKAAAHSAVILVDRQSYESAGITDGEGALVINYYDNKTKEKIKTQVVSQITGTKYDIEDIAGSLNYDIKSSSGDVEGEFSDGVKRAEVYVEEFKGKTGSVVFRFIDNESGKEIADSYLLRNREGLQYFTPAIPDIEGYSLMLKKLPANGAGLTPPDKLTVDYYYEKTREEDKELCKVNIVYMTDSGKIEATEVMKGKEGEEYTAIEKEFEDMNLIALPENFRGVFKKGEINVLFCYSSLPDPYSKALVVVGIVAGAVLLLCIFSFFYSGIRRKRKMMENMDIVEAENK